MGQSPPSSTYNEEGKGLPFFQGKAEFGEIYPVAAKYCSRPLRVAALNDILLSVRAPVGPVNLSPSQCCIGRGLSAIRGKQPKVDQMYLFYYLRSIETRLSERGQGSTFGAIGRKDLERIEVPHPISLDVQHRIASVLHKAHGIAQKREETNQLTKKTMGSVFLKMFGDPDVNPIGWKINELGELTTCLDHRRVPIKESEREIGDTPYYGANGRVGWIKGFIFDEPLLLLAEDGGNWSKFQKSAYRIRGKSWVNNHAHVLKENGRACLEFLESCLDLSDLTRYISGTTRGKLTRGMMDKIKIPTPPIDLQERFVRIAKKLEALQQLQKEDTQEIDELFHSLMHKAFSGKLVE